MSTPTTNPRMSRLLLLISKGGVDVVMSKAGGNELTYKHLPIAVDEDEEFGPKYIEAFETLAFDTPELTADYGRTDIVFDTPRFVVVPVEEAEEDKLTAMFEALWPDGDDEIIPTAGNSAATCIACAVPRRLVAFVQRTFGGARLAHRMRPLCRYFALGNLMRNTGKVHVHLHDTRMDIIAFQGENLLMANTFSIGGDQDALYYVMATARQLNFDVRTDQVLVSGTPAKRDTLMRNLRQYFANVMPAIFPADMFSAGADAMHAPFELIITPLCE